MSERGTEPIFKLSREKFGEDQYVRAKGRCHIGSFEANRTGAGLVIEIPRRDCHQRPSGARQQPLAPAIHIVAPASAPDGIYQSFLPGLSPIPAVILPAGVCFTHSATP